MNTYVYTSRDDHFSCSDLRGDLRDRYPALDDDDICEIMGAVCDAVDCAHAHALGADEVISESEHTDYDSRGWQRVDSYDESGAYANAWTDVDVDAIVEQMFADDA